MNGLRDYPHMIHRILYIYFNPEANCQPGSGRTSRRLDWPTRAVLGDDASMNHNGARCDDPGFGKEKKRKE